MGLGSPKMVVHENLMWFLFNYKQLQYAQKYTPTLPVAIFKGSSQYFVGQVEARCQQEKHSRKCIGHSLFVNYDSAARRLAFKSRVEHVCFLLTAAGQPKQWTHDPPCLTSWFAPAVFPGTERVSAVQVSV